MQQFDLLKDIPSLPAARQVDTSKTAAAKLEKSAASIRLMVLAAIKSRGARGATSKELSEITGYAYEAVQPRTSELRRQGLIADSKQRRASRAVDKAAIVWVAV